MAETPPWLSGAITRIRHLLTLPANWDSYGASPVDPSVADTMVRFLSDPMWVSTPIPMIVPTTEGGLSVGWRRDPVAIEVAFDPQGPGVAYVCDEFGAEWEGDLSEVPGGIEVWVTRLT